MNEFHQLCQVNEGVVREVVGMGFNVHEVIGSLLNNLQNQVLLPSFCACFH